MTALEAGQTIKVEIDSEIRSIIPEFLSNRKKDCLLIVELLNERAFDAIRVLGHRMKGAGGSFGFDDISCIGEVIELAAMAGDGEGISQSVAKLSQYLERVRVIYV